MSILRGIFILLVFFIGLYILRDTHSTSGSTIKSDYVNPFVQFFNDIKSSAVNLPGFLKGDNPQTFNMLGSDFFSSTTNSSNTQNNSVSGPAIIPTSTSTLVSSGTVSIVNSNNTKPASIDNKPKTNTVSSNSPIQIPFVPIQKSTPTVPVKSVVPTTIPISIPNIGDTSTELSISRIVQYTNVERLKAGLNPIKINNQLSISAGNKLQDIFKGQYFEHISPSGVGVSDLAKQAGYSYVVIGENLALGTFGSNQALLAAWMSSPGHRANILDSRYQDIGIAVGRGTFQGSMQWVAVQHFGKPLTACVQIDPALKPRIDAEKNFLIEYQKKIDTLKVQIDTLSGAAYREKAEEYNESVKDYNVRLAGLESDVARYNKMAVDFNSCIGTKPAN